MVYAKKAWDQRFAPFAGFVLMDGPISDARVLVDQDNNTVPAIVVWQDGLCLNGLCAAWAAHRYRLQLGLPVQPETQNLAQLITAIATTMTRHYFAQGPDGWQSWLNVKWTGAAPDPTLIAGSDNVVGQIRDRVLVQSDWFPWVASGLYYLAKADHGLPLPPDVKERVKSIAAEWDAEVAPQAGLALREWMAVVQR